MGTFFPKLRSMACAGALGCACLAPPGQVALAQSLQAHTENGVTYVSGGIGLDEEAEMLVLARDYPLFLEFSTVAPGEVRGHWAADVRVVIRQGTRVLLDTRSEGPLFLASLKPGRYMVDAEYDGRRVSREVGVGSKSAPRVRISWRE